MSITNCRECNAQISSGAQICPQCGFKPPPSLIRALLPAYFWTIFTGFQFDFFDTSQKFFNYSIDIYNYNIPIFLLPFILIPFAYINSFIKGTLFIILLSIWVSFTFDNSHFYNENIVKDSGPTSLLQSLESREDVSNYPIDGELASAFVLNSKNTDVQRENLLKEIKGKLIIWEVKVYEVKKIAEKVYRIQTSDSGTFFGKKVVGTFIEITAKDTLEANFIEQIKTDQIIRIKGIFTGDSSARNLNIKPAILWNPESKLKSDQSSNNPNKEEVNISKFSRCNGSYEMEKCEAIEEALIKSTEDKIQRQNNLENDRENKANKAQVESNNLSSADLEKAQKNFEKTPKYFSARTDLFAYFTFKYDPYDRILDGNNIYFEILYNQLFDDFEPFNWDSMFIKAFILMREKNPSWTWKDQVEQISLDQAAMGGHNYVRAANDLIANWGPGYALFLKSPLNLSSKDLDIMKKDITARFNDCRENINQLTPSNRPKESFCRGYATTGKVLKIK